MKRKNLYYVFLFSMLIFLGCNSTSSKEKSPYASNELEQNQERQQTPKNIILLIGDGMGLTQITAGMIANDNQLELERFPYIGLIKTSSFDKLITDSAAGATAFSTGKKTYNGAIGVDSDTTAVETILEIAGNGKYATGLVATSSITHATPASFFAHQPSRSMEEAIAMDMLSAPVDFFIGGGKDFFENREDGINLLDSLRNNGFKIYNEVNAIPVDGNSKVAGFIAPKEPVSMLNGRGDLLPLATQKAIDYLNNDNGFFLMVEGSQIDWAGHANDSDGIVAEMIDFDKAIKAVLDFAEKDGSTLVIVTADHETGGYAIIGGDMEKGTVEGAFTTGGHTADLIPVFAFGPGAESFSGIYENTAIFDKMMELLKN